MRAFGVLGKALKVFGVILLLIAAFLECYFIQPDPPGAWQVIADPAALLREISAFLAVLGLIGVAAIFLGIRLKRKGVAMDKNSKNR